MPCHVTKCQKKRYKSRVWHEFGAVVTPQGWVQQIHSPLGARGGGGGGAVRGKAHVGGHGVVGSSGVVGIARGSGENVMVAVSPSMHGQVVMSSDTCIAH